MLAVAVDESRSDHHLAAFALQRFENLGNVARIVLAVAIDADHVVVAQLEGQPVAGLHAAAQAQMMRQRQDVGARAARATWPVASAEQSSTTRTGTCRASRRRTSRTTPPTAPSSLKAGMRISSLTARPPRRRRDGMRAEQRLEIPRRSRAASSGCGGVRASSRGNRNNAAACARNTRNGSSAAECPASRNSAALPRPSSNEIRCQK